MDICKPDTPRQNKVSIRVLFPRADYKELKKLAAMERTDVSTLVRRAVARYFFIPPDSNTVNHKP
ncbi:MAG: ribbon-helix-helix domain-containing protein [Chloroflexota bacterium]